MAINKISGNILQDDLQRGSNLAIQGNLIYFDVINDRVGVLTSSPSDDFTVLGTSNAANVRITSATANRILYADSNKLAQTTANLIFNGTDLVLIGSAQIDNVSIDGTDISSDANFSIYSGSNGNIDITPNGTGATNISNLVVGNLDANRVVITLASGALADTDAFTFDGSGNILSLSGQANFDDLRLDSSTISTISANANLNLTPNGSGEVVAATLAIADLSANRVMYSQDSDGTVVDSSNFTFDGSNAIIDGSIRVDNVTIDGNNIDSDTALDITTAANGNITLQTNGTGVVRIPDTNGMVIPVGNTNQRPNPVDVGTIRFNTTINEIEVWDGTQWDEVGGAVPFTITNQTISPDGISNTFTLNQDATDASILLTINGVNQTPTVDYSVSGNVLALSDVPLSTDIIQVRFLAGIESNDRLTNTAGNATIVVETSGSIDLDSTGTVTVTGNLIPTANITYDLGNSVNRWRDLYLSGSTLTLGNIVIKNTTANVAGFFGPDGTTPATISANYADLAEKFAADAEYDPGTVLKFGGTQQVTLADVYADYQAAGIVTTNPAFLMDSGMAGQTASLALAGKVPCFVIGPVSKGDLLTTADHPGHACRLTEKDWRPGCVIAKSLEDCGPGPHKILVSIYTI